MEIPLIGFGEKRVNTIGKLSLSVSFGDTANAKTEHTTFDVVEMPYLYRAILRRGTINKFEAIIHQLYLCMKIPAPAGVITVRGDQQLARDIERGYTPGQKNVHNLRAESKSLTFKEQQRDNEKATFEEDCEVKKVPLDVHLPDKMVTLIQPSSPRKKKSFLSSSARIKMFLHGPPVTYGASAEISLSIAWISTQTSSRRSRSFEKWQMKKSQQSRPKSKDY